MPYVQSAIRSKGKCGAIELPRKDIAFLFSCLCLHMSAKVPHCAMAIFLKAPQKM